MNITAESNQRLERNAGRTRRLILDAAFQEIYRHGYQGMRLDVVLATTGLTKGALYHHFPNKQALGYAVIDEVIRGMVQKLWAEQLATSADPLGSIIHFVGHVSEIFGPDIVTYGCPVNNLAQEMSPLDEGFRVRLDQLLQDVKAHVRSRPAQLDWNRLNPNEIGYRLVYENQTEYIGERVCNHRYRTFPF